MKATYVTEKFQKAFDALKGAHHAQLLSHLANGYSDCGPAVVKTTLEAYLQIIVDLTEEVVEASFRQLKDQDAPEGALTPAEAIPAIGQQVSEQILAKFPQLDADRVRCDAETAAIIALSFGQQATLQALARIAEGAANA